MVGLFKRMKGAIHRVLLLIIYGYCVSLATAVLFPSERSCQNPVLPALR